MSESKDEKKEEVLFSLAAELGLLDLTDRLNAIQTIRREELLTRPSHSKEKPYSQLT